MNSTQSLQKPPFAPQSLGGELVDAAQVPQASNVTAISNGPLQTCENCDTLLDAQQRYCLNCGARSRYVTNPAVDFLAAQRRRKALTGAPVDDRGYGGTGITKRSLPWVAGIAVSALVLGLVFGGRGGNNDELLAALANQKPIVVAGAGATGATTAAATTLTSDFGLDKGYTVQVATVPTDADQAAVDAAKADATGKGATDVGLITATDFTIKPDPGANVIYSGQFEKEKDAEAALKKLKKSFPSATVIAVERTSGGGEATNAAREEELGIADAPKDEPITQKKVEEDKKAVEELDGKTGEDYVDGQKELDDVTVIDDTAPGPTGSTP